MPLFRKTEPAPSPPAQPGPPIDLMAGDPVAHRIRDDLAQGRWQDFHDFMEADRDWERRRFYLGKAVLSVSGVPDWVQEWVAARPASALPVTFRGALLKNHAWDARGSGWASTVKEDAWAVFHARLVEADRDLSRAAALDDGDPVPHSQGLMVAIGLQLGLPELKRRFGEVIRRDRWNGDAHHIMISGLAAKWGGSHEEMFGFARSASASAPEGSAVHRVIASAHLLRWQFMPRDTENGNEVSRTYFRREEVRAEVRQAALRSILSPRYVPGRFTSSDRNVFAMVLGLTRDYAAQLDQMALIGPLVASEPWDMRGKPGAVYQRALERAQAGVRAPEAQAWRPADPALGRR